MINAITLDSQYSQNVVNPYLGFIMPPNFSVVSGTGTVDVETVDFGFDNPLVFKGDNSLRIRSLDYQNTDLIFNGTADYNFRTATPQQYFLSFYLLRSLLTIPDTNLILEIFEDGSPYLELDCSLDATTMPTAVTWYRFGQIITFNSGFNYTFRWTLKSQSSFPINNITFYLDGFAIQKANLNNLVQPYTLPRPLVLEVNTEIDIPSIGSNSSYLLSVELLGARIGDYVSIDYPNELLTLGLIVGTAIVSDTDEVSVLIHNHSGGSINAGLGNYKFKIVK
jgi:hypothetical protein